MNPVPLLTIRRNFPRPPNEEIASLAAAMTGWIVDANGRRGALDASIRPLTAKNRFAGVALTVWSRSCDNLAPYAAIEFAAAGDVLVIATGAYREASVAGDVLLGMARNKGVVALVTDGMVRDRAGLDAVDIPVFAQGLTPNSPHKDGPGEIGLAVTIGGLTIASGDAVIGDQDGCVVVARQAIGTVLKALPEIRAKEEKMDALVRGGATRHDWLTPILEGRTRFVD